MIKKKRKKEPCEILVQNLKERDRMEGRAVDGNIWPNAFKIALK